jgi:glutathione S-transferase
LKKTGKLREYLVGSDRLTYADLAWSPWNHGYIGPDEIQVKEAEVQKEYPIFFAWHKRVLERPAVQAVMKAQV